jgi:hypothetical protein
VRQGIGGDQGNVALQADDDRNDSRSRVWATAGYRRQTAKNPCSYTVYACDALARGMVLQSGLSSALDLAARRAGIDVRPWRMSLVVVQMPNGRCHAAGSGQDMHRYHPMSVPTVGNQETA